MTSRRPEGLCIQELCWVHCSTHNADSVPFAILKSFISVSSMVFSSLHLKALATTGALPVLFAHQLSNDVWKYAVCHSSTTKSWCQTLQACSWHMIKQRPCPCISPYFRRDSSRQRGLPLVYSFWPDGREIFPSAISYSHPPLCRRSTDTCVHLHWLPWSARAPMPPEIPCSRKAYRYDSSSAGRWVCWAMQPSPDQCRTWFPPRTREADLSWTSSPVSSSGRHAETTSTEISENAKLRFWNCCRSSGWRTKM